MVSLHFAICLVCGYNVHIHVVTNGTSLSRRHFKRTFKIGAALRLCILVAVDRCIYALLEFRRRVGPCFTCSSPSAIRDPLAVGRVWGVVLPSRRCCTKYWCTHGWSIWRQSISRTPASGRSHRGLLGVCAKAHLTNEREVHHVRRLHATGVLSHTTRISRKVLTAENQPTTINQAKELAHHFNKYLQWARQILQDVRSSIPIPTSNSSSHRMIHLKEILMLWI